MTRTFQISLAVLAAAFALTLQAGASPAVVNRLARPQTYDGFLHRLLHPKLFHPKIDLGKAGRAVTYPVKKAAVNGGKAAVGAAASYYLPSKKAGIEKAGVAAILHKK